MPDNQPVPGVTPGNQTSEYQSAQSAKTWGIVSLILGLIVTVGPQLTSLPSVAANAHLLAIIGGVVAVAGILSKALVEAGYIKSRSVIKAAASEAAMRTAYLAAPIGYQQEDKPKPC